MSARIRKGDLVQVIAGADRGKQGRVVAVDAERRRVRVEKVRVQKHHLKPGRGANRTGGVVEQEAFIDVSNVMLVDPAQGKPSRVRFRVDAGGARSRVFARSGNPVPEATGR